MIKKQTKPYGSWTSSITAKMTAGNAIQFGDIQIDKEGVYWSEVRAEENGRCAILKSNGKAPVEILPSSYSARSTVHEYGGASFLIWNKRLFFSNAKDQQLYTLSKEGKAINLTHKPNCRYTNAIFDSKRNLLYAIEEYHSSKGSVLNRIVAIDPTGEKEVIILVEGSDFYSSLALQEEKDTIAFLTWDHPNMPWDGTKLWTGILDTKGKISKLQCRAGGSQESIFQPLWSREGDLYFISDQTGWWNIYRLSNREIFPCCPMEAEFGLPQWIFGMSRYGLLPTGEIAAIYTKEGIDFLGLLDPKKAKIAPIDLPFSSYNQLRVCYPHLLFLAASETTFPSLLTYNLLTRQTNLIRESTDYKIEKEDLSTPVNIAFPTTNAKTAFGFYYPPKNRSFSAPSGEKPPLLVKSHGGPSARVSAVLSLELQFWTNRGFAVLEVNYGGSTGYGREYRERLKGKWGEVDVDDCIHGALYLIEKEKVDRNRLIIKGGSAGGYTALAALAFHTFFHAGVSYYGVSDLESLAKETHKFELHYLDSLIAPYPKYKERYKSLSPIHHAEKILTPLLLLQGEEDPVVPPAQSENMFTALKERKITVSYLLFPGEKHGFRMAKNREKALEAELYFYSKIFLFSPGNRVTPIPIENLPIT